MVPLYQDQFKKYERGSAKAHVSQCRWYVAQVQLSSRICATDYLHQVNSCYSKSQELLLYFFPITTDIKLFYWELGWILDGTWYTYPLTYKLRFAIWSIPTFGQLSISNLTSLNVNLCAYKSTPNFSKYTQEACVLICERLQYFMRKWTVLILGCYSCLIGGMANDSAVVMTSR